MVTDVCGTQPFLKVFRIKGRFRRRMSIHVGLSIRCFMTLVYLTPFRR
jgi:hypothetical protein